LKQPLSSIEFHNKRVQLYFAAGVATAPQFMFGIAANLEQRFKEIGWTASSKLVFPYGDWSRKLVLQLAELQLDMLRPSFAWERSIGGRRFAAEIWQEDQEGPIILIGHSGGGIAALHAAYSLQDERFVRLIFQIGSPRCPVPARLRDKAYFIYGVNQSVKRPDPITLLGYWGRSAATRIPLPLLGNHADYFRDASPYVNSKGETNLNIVSRTILDQICKAWL
jgi:pimeloyl-ACP methyl ester carboxylesterase